MKVRVSALLLLLLCFWAQPSLAEQQTSAGAEPVIVRVSPIANKSVTKWSVADVEYWMNHTVGYAEYSLYVRKHLIDGPTLLGMEPLDFEEHFPIENAIHVIKLAAHLKLVKGLCLCAAVERRVVDFWSYFRQENFRVWVVGLTSFFFPRVGMLYTLLFDGVLYRLLLGVTVPQSTVLDAAVAEGATAATTVTVPFLHTVLFLLCLVAAPDLFMAFQSARLVASNYFMVPFLVTHFLLQGYNEYFYISLLFNGVSFLPAASLDEKIWALYSYTLLIPPAALLLYPILPYLLQTICIYLLLVHAMLMVIGAVYLNLDGKRETEAQKSGKKG
ncbi:hypothetical protein DQ04_02791110 [Trypanosoma grayi]|uniref:hypothetical protein n=1 Tax=Trypanosoma grayi TaxID=71804 RepID=UPI0004F49E9E|nr:hypothetical protein DQ04_02791110 [Trypanosoma grayi]KEG11276.1 hypothetical protein DQ04_02791110 [Trypanosoma grayi]